MHIGIYARKSNYSDKSDSVESQIRMCKDYAESNYTVDTILEYKDEGFTGANINRPGFTSLMNDVKEKKIDVLICYKIDRISRNVLDFSETFNMLQENCIEFVSLKEQIDTSTPLGRAMMYICSVFAQMERETIAERVKDNMIELAKSGKWAGGKPPLGYQLERTVVNGKSHTKLALNVDETGLLNCIYDTFLSGFSLNSLEKHFRNIGVKTVKGNYLSSTQLYQILSNPHYVAATQDIYDFFKQKGCIMAAEKDLFNGTKGIIVYGRTSGGKKKSHISNTSEKWIVSVGIHEPLISSEKWLSVQRRFGLNKIDKTRKHQIGILKGIVRCKCGYAMRVKHKVDKIYNKIYDSYYCPNRERKGSIYCDMKMVSVYDLDDSLIEILKDIKADKNLLHKYIDCSELVPTFRTKDIVRRDIISAEKKINNLTDTIKNNGTSSAIKYLLAEIENLDRQITGLNYELREIDISEREAAIKEDDIDSLYNAICYYIENFESLTYENRVTFLKDIIKECTWNGVKLRLHF